MKIDSAIAKYIQSPLVGNGTVESQKAVSDNPTPSLATDLPSLSQGAPVSLSGRSIMLSRLFHSQASDADPSVISVGTNATRNNLSQNPVDFLTDKDLSLVSDMYADAQKQGTDPVYVDTLAITLGTYRQFDDGKRLSGFNEGQLDLEGHQLSSSYSASDTATANRILSSDAMSSTRLDPGFVKYILQPSHALSNMANIDFMEQTVTKFSGKGVADLPPSGKFANFSSKDSAVNTVVITTSKEVVSKPSTTQIANINGHWFILDPSLLDDPASLKATGLNGSQLADAKSNNAIVALALLGADSSKTNGVSLKLFDLLATDRKPLML